MDTNFVILSGELAAPVELRTLNSGAITARYLLTIRSDDPKRRVDVVPVTQWDPPSGAFAYSTGTRLYAIGSVQRRFWSGIEGRRSQLEVVATQVVRSCSELEIAL